MFTTQITKVIEFGEHTVVIRKLSWKSLRHAAQVKQEEDMRIASAATAALRAGGPALADAWRRPPAVPERTEAPPASQADATPPDPTAAAAARRLLQDKLRAARYYQYDMGTALQAGIQSWSMAEKVTPALIEDLPQDAAVRLFREIVDLALGPIDAEEAKVEQGNV